MVRDGGACRSGSGDAFVGLIAEAGLDPYVAMRESREHLRRRSPNDPNDTFEELNPGVFSYWVLDLRKPEAFGPLTEEQFDSKRKELGVSDSLTLHDVNDYRP